MHLYLNNIDKDVISSRSQTHFIQKHEPLSPKVVLPLQAIATSPTPSQIEIPTALTKPVAPDSTLETKSLQDKNPPVDNKMENKKAKVQKDTLARRPAALMKKETMKASADGSVYLEWLKDTEIREYRLSLQGSNNQIIKRWTQKKNFTTLKNLKPGNYKITVRGQDKKGLLNIAESNQTFEIPSESNIQAPKLKGIKIK